MTAKRTAGDSCGSCGAPKKNVRRYARDAKGPCQNLWHVTLGLSNPAPPVIAECWTCVRSCNRRGLKTVCLHCNAQYPRFNKRRGGWFYHVLPASEACRAAGHDVRTVEEVR